MAARHMFRDTRCGCSTATDPARELAGPLSFMHLLHTTDACDEKEGHQPLKDACVLRVVCRVL